MSMDLIELQKIFEYELKRKLAQRCRTRNDELRFLLNSFKFYDYESSLIIDKNKWIKGVLKTGLSGFSIKDLTDVFASYDLNNTGFINYQNFTYHLYGREEILPISNNFTANNKELINQQNNNNRVKSPYIEFQPPGLYERNYEPTEYEKKLNLRQQNINFNQYQQIINNHNKNNNIEQIQKQSPNTPFLGYSNNNSKINSNTIDNSTNNNLSVENYSFSYENDSYFKKLLLLLQSKINIENGVAYYTFAEKLKSYENNVDNIINLNSFYSALRDFNIPLALNDLTDFFKYLDKSNSNKVPTDFILRIIRGNLSEKRKNSIQYIYSLIDRDKMGRVPIDLLKSLYNCKLHPDVYIGFKQEEDIYKEFCYTLDIFCNLYNINKYITCDQFVEYYWGISASIKDDKYFEDILSGVWNKNIKINKNINLIINENLNIHRNYDENYRKELMGNRITNNNNYYLNNRYVNDQNQNNYNYINFNSNSKLTRNKSQSNYDISNLAPIKENEINCDRVTPYYHPSKTPLYKGVKMFRSLRHNPITNEFIMSKDTTNNAYLEPSYDNNNRYNNLYDQKTNNIHINSYKNYQISSINHNVNNNNKPTKELDELKNAIVNRGQKGIFIFQKLLNLYDKNRTGEIAYNRFNELLEIFNITLSKQNINSIFKYYDNGKKGIIKYNDLIIDLIGNVNQSRELIIKNVYNNFIRGEGNNISLNDLKQKFKGYNHPDVKSGIKSETEVYYDFLEIIDIFKNYKNSVKNENNDIITYEDFLDFYKEISMSIKDDKVFEDLLFQCWNNNKGKNIYVIERSGGTNNLQDNNLRIRTANQILNNKGYNY